MAILIKGMEMPENCTHCPMEKGITLDIKGSRGMFICSLTGFATPLNRHPYWCPLVEVMEPKRIMSRKELEAAGFET